MCHDHSKPVVLIIHPGTLGDVVLSLAAIQVIRNGDTIATGGFVGIGFPEQIAVAQLTRGIHW